MRSHGLNVRGDELVERRHSVSGARLRPQPVYDDGARALSGVVAGSLLLVLLACVMAGLKMTSVIAWSWWTVTSPLWSPGLLMALALGMTWGAHCLATAIARSVGR